MGLILSPLPGVWLFDLTPDSRAFTDIPVLGAPGNSYHGKHNLETKSDKQMPAGCFGMEPFAGAFPSRAGYQRSGSRGIICSYFFPSNPGHLSLLWGMCNIRGFATCDQPPVVHAFPNWPFQIGLEPANWTPTHYKMWVLATLVC